MSFKAMTPKIAGFRPGPTLLRIRQKARRFKSMPDRPYLSDGAIRRIEEMLMSPISIMEYGAGASTVYFAKRGARVLSVETDPDFAKKIQRKVNKLRSSDITILTPTIGPTRQWGFPKDDTLTQRNLSNWREYVEGPWRHAEASEFSPDVVLVDGRFRVASAAYSLIRLAQNERGGTLIFDDYDREEYKPIHALVIEEQVEGKTAFLRRRPDVDLQTCQAVYEANLTSSI